MTDHTPGAESSEPAPANPYLRLVERLEGAAPLDRVVDAIAPLVEPVVANRSRRDFFDGAATGIPPHVILTDVPFGAWFMAQYLDLFGDESSRVAARRLVGFGLVAAAPTAFSGWARWVGRPQETRRVGVVHAAANVVAVLTYVGSWAARRSGRDRLGANLARAGSLPLVVGGFLGGHLRHEPTRRDTPPADVP